MNADWHHQHPMGSHPTQDERIAWHLAHAAACACRPIPAPLLDEIRARRLDAAGDAAADNER
jgi:hypothetical protein